MTERLALLMESQAKIAVVLNFLEEHKDDPTVPNWQAEWANTSNLFVWMWEEIWELEHQISNQKS